MPALACGGLKEAQMKRTFLVGLGALVAVWGCARPPNEEGSEDDSDNGIAVSTDQAALEVCPVPMFSKAATLNQLLDEVFARAEQRARADGSMTQFYIDDPSNLHFVQGELRRGSSPIIVRETILTVPGALAFSSKQELLNAMLASVNYDVEVRLVNYDIVPTCKPAGYLSGRVEGRFQP
jgi:hypothetical protein